MRYYLFLCITLLICSLSAQPEIALQDFASGFDRPLDITHAGDARVFVVEQDGVIKIVENGIVLPTPFLDIDARVRSTGNEQGLLGLAFHPDYANNGWFFVNYSNSSGDTQVSRFSVSADNPDVADPDSELMILFADQPYSNHNGGCIKFGADGYLYIGMGDGGSGGDPDGYGQNRMSLLGKMLRIDVNNSEVGAPYVIPENNPFAADDFTLDEIWAIGVRNPWRFSFDRETGDLWIGDVGQGDWEEIDFQSAESVGGENYGWRCYEGDHTYNTSQCGGMEEYDFPVFEYPNSFTGGCSVTGGYTYRGTNFPELVGHYLFADYCAGVIISLKDDGAGGFTDTELLTTGSFVSSFGEDSKGELYMVDLFGGRVSKIVDAACVNFTVAIDAEDEQCEGQENGSIDLTIPSGSSIVWSTGDVGTSLSELSPATYLATVTNGDGCRTELCIDISMGSPFPASPTIVQDNHDLSVAEGLTGYQWYLDGEAISNANSNTYTAEQSGNYFVEVSNEGGCTASSDEVLVEVVNTLEILSINSLEINPVPFKSSFNLNMNVAESGDYSFTILSADGEKVLSQKDRVSSVYTKTINMENQPSGLYFLIIEKDGHHFTRRVVKQ